MANKRSAKKEARKNVKRRFFNKMTKSSISTQAKKVNLAILSNDPKKAATELSEYQKVASRAGRKNILNKLAISRKIGRFAKKLKSIYLSTKE